MTYELMQAAYETIDEIKKEPCYQRKMELEKRINNELVDLLQKFNQAKETFAEAQDYGVHYPGYQDLASELSAIKKELYMKPIVIEYKKCEKEMEEILEKICQELNAVLRR